MNVAAAIFESDIERDRKECIRLDQRVTGANRELAEWLLNHSYTNREVGEWLNRDQASVGRLKRWAAGGFQGTPFDRHNKPDNRPRHDIGGAAHQVPLKSLGNYDTASQPSCVPVGTAINLLIDEISNGTNDYYSDVEKWLKENPDAPDEALGALAMAIGNASDVLAELAAKLNRGMK